MSEVPDAIDELETKKERYAVARLCDLPDGKANDVAGYESKTPSDARELYERARSAKLIDGEIETYRERIDDLREEIHQLRRTIRAYRVWRAMQT